MKGRCYWLMKSGVDSQNRLRQGVDEVSVGSVGCGRWKQGPGLFVFTKSPAIGRFLRSVEFPLAAGSDSLGNFRHVSVSILGGHCLINPHLIFMIYRILLPNIQLLLIDLFRIGFGFGCGSLLMFIPPLPPPLPPLDDDCIIIASIDTRITALIRLSIDI